MRMRSTSLAVVTLGVVSLACACDEDKKSAETTAPSATASPSATTATAPPAPKDAKTDTAKFIEAEQAAWNAHDPAKVGALYAATAKLVIPGMPDFSGRQAIGAEARGDFAGFPDFKVAITRAFVHGNTVVTEWVVTGKNDGPFMGQKATGRPMGLAGASVSVLDEGLVQEEHRYFDMPTMTKQLDAKAKAGSFREPMALPTAALEVHVSKGTPEEAKALAAVDSMYAGFEGKNAKDLVALVGDDTVFDDFTSPPAKGPKAVQDGAQHLWKAMPDLAQTKPLQFAADDFVVTEGTLSGTQKGDLGTVKATNKPVSLRFVDIGQVRDGKIAHFETFANNAEMLIELGAMKPMAAAPPAGAVAEVPAHAAAPK
jgi:predicted ester cyclase